MPLDDSTEFVPLDEGTELDGDESSETKDDPNPQGDEKSSEAEENGSSTDSDDSNPIEEENGETETT